MRVIIDIEDDDQLRRVIASLGVTSADVTVMDRRPVPDPTSETKDTPPPDASTDESEDADG